ncbi:hypothetical protein N7468_003738 [Penicillium chermesinum]|uniref:Uncharacterized protein n=1 Tax=Penicillium chermesinum TaxID=63820 RepID=A0A9W9P6Z4_9EURO|nr:uncharacterized protein N7468_003738 [Penicillium chermesinum]KAJ5239119.1 hypothetical protein N7468_003738 [Penicillium chermesinum]
MNIERATQSKVEMSILASHKRSLQHSQQSSSTVNSPMTTRLLNIHNSPAERSPASIMQLQPISAIELQCFSAISKDI